MMSLLKPQEAAAILKISLVTLYRYTEARRITCVKLNGRNLRYRQSDLDKFISEGVVEKWE